MAQSFLTPRDNNLMNESHLYDVYNNFYNNNHNLSNSDQDTSFLLPHHNKSQERHWPTAWTILNFLNNYYIPFIFVVGLVGNTISCIVFLGTHLRIRSSSYYLAALAVADVAFLLSLFLVWLASMGVEVFNQNGWCQIVVYLSSVSSFLSVWFIIAFTVERFIAIQYPLQRPQMCTVKRAKVTVGILALFAFVAHSYLLCVAGLVAMEAEEDINNDMYTTDNAVYVCGLLPSFYSVMKVINSVDTVVTLILPVVLILCMNSLIARQLYQFSKKYRNTTIQLPSAVSTPASGSFTHNRSAEHYSNDPNGPSSSQSGNSGSRSHNNNNSNNSNCGGLILKGRELNSESRQLPSHRSILSQRTQYTITKMLLLISTVFVLLNLPSYVFRLYLFVRDAGGTSSAETNEFEFIVQQFSMLLYYSNFSVNFLLYSMYGMTFRRALTQLARTRLHLSRIWKTRSDSFQFK